MSKDNPPTENSGDLRDVRREYSGSPLRRETANANPFQEADEWMQLAAEYQPEDSTAMVLATASVDGMPSARTVLLKHYDADGFCWYSNSGSEKGSDLSSNPRAALHFYWRKLDRQLRISGTVKQLSRAQAVDYFDSRPEGSRVSAAVSRQTSVVENRDQLERETAALLQQFPDGNIPCPEDWCGYRLQPSRFEFWQGRENRLHDRLRYSLQGSNWLIERLAP